MDQVIVVVYLLVVLVIGIWAGRKVVNVSQFSVGGRSFGTWVIFATLSASFIGGGFSTGNAEKVFRFGIANIFALWGFSLKEILVAKFIAPRMKKYPEAISVGDIMKTHYGSFGQIVTGIFSVILCAGILGAQVGAIGYIFKVFLGIAHIYGILIGCGIVIIYSTIGGMRAVVFTDVIQFVVLAIGIPLTVIFGIQYVGGWSSFVASIPAEHLSFSGTNSLTLIQFIGLFLTFLLGETLVPPYVQRLFLSKHTKHTERGTFYSGLFSIPFFAITGIIGLIALSIDHTLDPNLAMPFVIMKALPVGLKGIVIAGIISIVMSSADSFLNSAAVAFSHDIIKPLSRKGFTDKIELLYIRLSNLVTGVLAIIVAVKIKSILDILVYSYNFWSPVILVPLLAVMLGLNPRRIHFILSSAAGILAVSLWNFVLHKPFDLDGLVVGILVNLLVFAISYKLIKNQSVVAVSASI
ncbi:MAG: sodium:solute symporter family protein [Candidatus Cloacimonadales bacterium]